MSTSEPSAAVAAPATSVPPQLHSVLFVPGFYLVLVFCVVVTIVVGVSLVQTVYGISTVFGLWMVFWMIPLCLGVFIGIASAVLGAVKATWRDPHTIGA